MLLTGTLRGVFLRRLGRAERFVSSASQYRPIAALLHRQSRPLHSSTISERLWNFNGTTFRSGEARNVASVAASNDQGRGRTAHKRPKQTHKPMSSDYITIFGLGCCCLSAFGICTLVGYRYLEFKSQEFDKAHSFKQYLQYSFTEWFGTSTYSQLIVLTLITQGVWLASAVFYSRARRMPLAEGLWKSWSWIISPDGGAHEGGAKARIVGALTSIGGIVVFALLVSMITEAFARKMSSLKESQEPIIEANHMVLLGWTDKSPTLVSEIGLANESEGGIPIAILDPRPLPVLRQCIDDDTKNLSLNGSFLVARSGDPFIKRDLIKVSAETAKSIIIQSDPTAPSTQSDAVSMQKVLSLKNYGWPANGSIVVHVAEHMNKELFISIGGNNVYVVILDKILAQIAAQCTLYPGISKIFSRLTGFEGNELYIAAWPELIGRSFRDILFTFEDAIPIGVFKQSGEFKLAVESDYVLEEDDSLIVIAEDNDSYSPARECIINFRDWLQNYGCHCHPKGIGRSRSKQVVRALVVGWNHGTEQLLFELEHCSPPGSFCTVFAERPIQERVGPVSLGMNIGGPLRKIGDFKIYHEVGSPVARGDLLRLKNLSKYDVVFLFADGDSWGRGPSWTRTGRLAADATNIASLVLMRDILGVPQGSEHPIFVTQVLDVDTLPTFKHCSAGDIMANNLLVSQMLAMVSEEPRLLEVIKEVASTTKRSNFHILPLEAYFTASDPPPREVSFWDIVCFVKRASDKDIVVGWDVGKSWVLNPPDKHKKILWSPKYRIVVIGPGAEPVTKRYCELRDYHAMLYGHAQNDRVPSSTMGRSR